MFEVRIHGRGGQGVVTAAELLSIAAFAEGKYAQAFPTFGSERMGAPVVSFCRWSEHPIRVREPIATPDAVILQDPTLLQSANPFHGLKPSGWLLINSDLTTEELGISNLFSTECIPRLSIIPASSVAVRYLGKPLPNACLLGAFAALTGLLNIDSVVRAIREKFSGHLASRNESAAHACYDIALERSLAYVETA
ncbi:MAG: 2-oxoacid:acceptor oxidoreductase family protein [Acidobacteriaceae bacterium]|nr:2-oxoacid:acceptor oxidoreductase family protein [Acidobacteriaceae bacterium]